MALIVDYHIITKVKTLYLKIYTLIAGVSIMLFSNFITDSISGKNDIIWNYYGAGMKVDDILQANASRTFIHDYFKNGGKDLPLILNPNDAAEFLKNYFWAGQKERVLSFEFDERYSLPGDRAIHTVSGFFLGLLIESCLNSKTTLSIELPDIFPFSYIWFLTFLYHDYGYCVAEREDSPITVPRAPVPNTTDAQRFHKISFVERNSLREAKAKLGINLSPFSAYSSSFPRASNFPTRKKVNLESCLLHELTRRSCTIAGHSKLRFNTGTVIHGPQYTSTIVTRYFNYCINERARLDHGIIGGYLFYDRMIKNYLFAYLHALHENQYSTSLGDFYFHNRHFSENQLPVFSYIADCILVHNIWKQTEDTRTLYERYNLNIALGEDFKIITYGDNPLLYILVVTDTLEPTKAYPMISPRVVSEAINLEYQCGTHELSFSSCNEAVDIGILHRRAKELEGWTSARCTELKNGTFTLFL